MNYKHVGISHPIHDAREKASGACLYAGDMQLKGMAHIAVIRSSIPNGLVTGIDYTEAEKIPGVRMHLDCFEDTGNLYTRYRSMKGGSGVDQEHIFNRRVRFVGDPVGCILADSPETARMAVSRVKVSYEEYPAALTPEESLAGKAGEIHPCGPWSEDLVVEEGTMPEGEFLRVDTHTRLSRIAHVTMEPHVCTADYNAYTGDLTLWTPTQSVFGIRTVVADIFGLPYNKVRVVKTTMGGSFGCKQEWITEPIAALAAIRSRGPVQLVFSRAEEFSAAIVRAPMDLKVEAFYADDGHLMSLQVDNTLDAGAYLGNSKDVCGAFSNKFFRCYQYPHMKYTARPVITNNTVSGSYRGWSSPEFAMMIEHNLNMAARKLGIDPVEIRLMNAAKPGDTDWRIDQSLGEIRLREALEQGRSSFRWEEKKAARDVKNAEKGRFRRGIAVACGGHLSGYFPRVQDFTTVQMRMTETGDVIANITLHDHGCGTVEVFRLMIAETLGLAPEQIRVGEGDTGVTPFDMGCYSSRSTYSIGRGAVNCAEKLLAALEAAVADLEDVPAEQLSAENGRIVSRDGRSWGYDEIVQASHRILQREITAMEQYKNKSNPGVTGAHFAEVEVDTWTANVKILDYLAVHDIGKAINPEHCRGQVQGAVAMGAGAALREVVPVNSRGKALDSLEKYKVMNIADLPEVRVEFVEDGQTDGPFGCKSIGEIAYVPPAAAIVGAVNDALGSDLCSIPLSQDVLGAWIEEHEEELR